MEKRISFLEGFGDHDQGDGFQAASAAVAPGATSMTVCALFRLETFDMTAGLGTDWNMVAGNVIDDAAVGWNIDISGEGVLVQAGHATLQAGYNFTLGDKPVGGRVIAAHRTVAPQAADPTLVVARLFVQGTLITEFSSATAPVSGVGLMSIGADGVLTTHQPFGDSERIPSARNGIAGVAYGEFTMSDGDVAEHYRQILEAEDVTDGDFGWNNLWSVRKGMPDLELAGGDSAAWTDEIGGAVLTRTQFNGQTPSMSNTLRPARVY